MRKLIRYWLPPLVTMAVIFLLSSRPRFSITPISVVDLLIFKTLHMIEYATLYFLLFRALWGSHKSKKVYLWAFVIAIVYAASDEIHQTFVPGREGRLRDVIIDTAGMTIMYSYIKMRFSHIKKYLS